ncbi:hypothetical protein WT83_19190 [Burkholderia territorii]|uniref:Uncharacterized protein n=1 Tax=Burkholderia territorii TaxID=1503055 RepID=A0A125K5T6_9BURK|nr:hypothetical protein WT83_19190 [Burkholderia territorii]
MVNVPVEVFNMWRRRSLLVIRVAVIFGQSIPVVVDQQLLHFQLCRQLYAAYFGEREHLFR